MSQRLLIESGILFIALGAYDLSHVTLQTGSAGIVRAGIVQGVGFSFLFVSLTTAALASVPRTKLADATGLNSLLRQIGGSVGLAAFATLLSNYAVHAHAAIAAHLPAGRPEVLERLGRLQAGFVARGFDDVSARAAALKALAGTATQQATVMSFERLFLLTGLLFLLVLPLLFFLKVNRNGPAEHPAEAVVE